MSAPKLELVRASVATLCARHGVTLVSPDSPSALRSAVRLTVAAVSPLTLDEVTARGNFYVPAFIGELYDLLPAPVRALAPIETPAALFSDRVWGDPSLLVGVGAHEVGHRLQDLRASAPAGIIGSVVHGAAYVIHETVRADSEVTCDTHDLAAAVILTGADPDAYCAGLLDVLRSSYRLGDHAIAHARQTLRSAAASLKAGQLPGVGTPLHELLRALVAGGWDPGPWASAIAGDRVTAVPS